MYYYELLRTVPETMFNPELSAGVYRAKQSPIDMPTTVVAATERVWQELGAEISYFKHRRELPVDMKEFTFIKLIAKEIK